MNPSLRPDAHRLVTIAILTGTATALHALEGLLPPLPFPGVKLGLANAVSLVTLRTLGFLPALGVSVARSLLGGLLGGSLLGPSFLMGLAGAVVSTLVMAVGVRVQRRSGSSLPVSVAGAIAHSTAQVAVAAVMMRHPGLWGYWPLLALLSSVTGFFIGLVCDRTLDLVKH